MAITGRLQGRASRALLLIVIVAVQFALFETALRTWGSSEAAPAFQALFTGDPHLGYRLLPGARTQFRTPEFDTTLVINSSGVRDNEEIGPKEPGERRILVLGDSMVLAVQVDFPQTFGELLEHRLNTTASAGRVRVINAGVQGFGPVQQLLFFRHVAAAFEPDVVVVTIYVGNDAEEAVVWEPQLLGTRPAALDAVRDTLLTRLRRLVRRSMVLQVLRLRAIEATRIVSRPLGPPEPPLQSYAAQPVERIFRGIALTRQAVERLADEASAAGARTVVLLMPARFQVDHADYGRLLEIVRQAGGDLQRDGATRLFQEAFEDLSLPVFDLLPALRSATPGPDLFFQHTAHLTPRGHQVVAMALAEFLQESGLAHGGAPPAER